MASCRARRTTASTAATPRAAATEASTRTGPISAVTQSTSSPNAEATCATRARMTDSAIPAPIELDMRPRARPRCSRRMPASAEKVEIDRVEGGGAVSARRNRCPPGHVDGGEGEAQRGADVEPVAVDRAEQHIPEGHDAGEQQVRRRTTGGEREAQAAHQGERDDRGERHTRPAVTGPQVTGDRVQLELVREHVPRAEGVDLDADRLEAGLAGHPVGPVGDDADAVAGRV